MSDVLNEAVAALSAKMDGSFDGTAKFVIEGEGSIMIKGDTVAIGDEPADLTLEADTETFKSILDGSLDPTTAFMTGKLSVDNVAMAMQLAPILS
ncbi:SCP2 sterol-binding domain-containing protein [Actibacterium sp. 188UL27-1]|uniref:SCP2 sterol-binding domain-containing protein n=1 Tax=Actibacterium sp. 188UL27-1 TaxID=2786961 RepID=UPI00195A0D53|nr:SCP2 sterol-binding domain-containing protein [Actibacterium sp. 188UL27-1]MBM7066591.1 SCP2 sterol-binding domain-containing protein [Actibacterium sp. 188UL27-1]